MNSKQIPISVTRVLANNIYNKTATAYTSTAGELSLSSSEITQTETETLINHQVISYIIRHIIIVKSKIDTHSRNGEGLMRRGN